MNPEHNSYRLYHAFVRRREGESHEARRQRSLKTLESILSNGLVCTPEKLYLYPNPKTTIAEKQNLLRCGKPHDNLVQSRACFTLCYRKELAQAHRLEDSTGDHLTTALQSHVDVFGSYAIALDPLEGRELGILPTIYYYSAQPSRPYGIDYIGGLSQMLLDRLDQVRGVLAVLSHIEAIAHELSSDPVPFLNQSALKGLRIEPKYEQKIQDLLSQLPPSIGQRIFSLFNTDRPAAWQLFDSIELLLSAFQTADSTTDDAPLAFFRQREWRLIHHNISHLDWFSLGNLPAFMDPAANRFSDQRSWIREQFEGDRESHKMPVNDSYYDNCWVLAEVHGKPFRHYIREIIAPKDDHEFIRTQAAKIYKCEHVPYVSDLPESFEL